MQANTFTMTLEDAYLITPNVKHFIFKCAHDPAFTYLPGQFITLYFEYEGKTLNRSYSIANPPANDQRIEFAAGFIQDGPGTTFLFQLKPGDTVQARGPFGRLILKEETPKRYLLVATSTGITPYRAMLPLLKQHLNDHPHLEIVLLQGVQTHADLLYHQEFMDFATHHPRVTYRAQLSRAAETDLSDREYSGYVQQAFSELALDPEQDLVYLCGNPNMVDDAFATLKDYGFPLPRIIREKYISR
jgi:ferredoxin-NADP reductase